METSVSSSTSISVDVISSPKLLADEIIRTIQEFIGNHGRMQFDKARDVVETERLRYTIFVANRPSVRLWHTMLGILSQWALSESSYYSLNMFMTKFSFRKENHIREIYGQLRNELQKCVSDGNSLISTIVSNGDEYVVEKLLIAISNDFIRFTSVRVDLIDFYIALPSRSWVNIAESSHKRIVEISSFYSTEDDLRSELPSALQNLDICESCLKEISVLRQLFEIQQTITACNMIDSLILLKELRNTLCKWFSELECGVTAKPVSSFFLSFAKKTKAAEKLALPHFFNQFYQGVLAKFTLYFHDVLSPFVPQSDLKAAYTATNSFLHTFQNFYRKSSPQIICILVSRIDLQTSFYGFGYHRFLSKFSSEYCKPASGILEKYPTLFVYPQEKRIFDIFYVNILTFVQEIFLNSHQSSTNVTSTSNSSTAINVAATASAATPGSKLKYLYDRGKDQSLFRLQKLRRLGLSDNDIHRLPSEVATLQNLIELNISRNDISDLPEDLKNCRNLLFLDVSSNPIARLPDTITQVSSLTQLSLNDTSLTKLPQDIGQLRALKSLEVRENHLRSLPASIVQLIHLLRLDLGQNELDVLPTELGALRSLQELYADDNSIESLPESILQCTALEQLDVSSNRLLTLPSELGDMTSLVDLSLSHNCLSFLPNSIGRLKRLTILRLDDNSFLQLTPAIGSCSSLNELYLMQNLISELPSTIGNLQNLQNLNVDKNQLTAVPPLIGECSSLSLLSFRDNQIEQLPMEIGKLTRLRVLDVCNNRLSYLPFTINVLFNLQALWLSENQSQALLKLQQEVDTKTGMKVLTCYLLPQQSAAANEVINRLPNRSFVGGPKVHFGELDDSGGGSAPLDADDVGGGATTTAGFGNFERHDTPHPKPNTKAPAGAAKPTKKTSIDGHIIPRLDDPHHAHHQTTISLSKKPTDHPTSNNSVQLSNRPNMPRPALKHSTAAFHAQNQQNTNENFANKQMSTSKEKSVAFSSDGRRSGGKAPEGDSECRLKRVNTPHYGKGYSLSHNHNAATTSGRDGVAANSPSSSANVTVFSATGRPQQQQNNGKFMPINTSFSSSSNSTAFPAAPLPHQNRFSAEDYYQHSSAHPLPSSQQHSMLYAAQSSYHSPAASDQLIDGMLKADSIPTASAVHQYASKSISSDSTISLVKPSSAGFTSMDENQSKRFITKRIVVRREPNHGLGLSIAGGVESNPYIDGDCGLFISKLIPAAPAERAGLRVSDKILEINGTSMNNQRHDVAVECIQKSPELLNLVVSRLAEGPSTATSINEQKEQNKHDDSELASRGNRQQNSASTSFLNQSNDSPNVISTVSRLNEKGLPNFSIRQQNATVLGQKASAEGSGPFFVISTVSHRNHSSSSSIGSQFSSSVIEVGDRLLSVNGVNIDEGGKTLSDVLALLKGAPGAEIYLVIGKTPDGIAREAATELPLLPERSAASRSNATSLSSLRNAAAFSAGQSRASPALSNEHSTPPNPSTALKSASNGGENVLTVSDIRYGDTRLDGLVEEVELRRDANNALGLSIVGGVDHCSHPFGADAPGVFISKIAENSPAADSRRLRVGDRILRVNGRDVEKAKHGEAVEALKKSGSLLRIGIRHEPQPRGLRELSFRRRANDAKLGLSICGGINSPPVIAADPSDEGIFIERVEPRGCAALECPQLSAGMRILEVNDDSLLGCTKSEAAELLRAAASPVRLLVCEGFLPMKSQEDVREAASQSYTQQKQHQQLFTTATSVVNTSASSPTADNFIKQSERSFEARQFSSTTNLPHPRIPSMSSLSQSENAPHQITRFSTTLAQAPTKMEPPIAPKPQPPQRVSSSQLESSDWNFATNSVSKSASSTSFSASSAPKSALQSATSSSKITTASQQHSPSNENKNGTGKQSSPYASAPSTSSNQNTASTIFGKEPNHLSRNNNNGGTEAPPSRGEWFSTSQLQDAADLGGGGRAASNNDPWRTTNGHCGSAKPTKNYNNNNNDIHNNDKLIIGSLVERNNNSTDIKFVDEPSEG